MKDNEIIELYQNRDEKAIKETDKKYSGYCFVIANNILGDHEDSKECVNDTWFKVWNAIPPQFPKCFPAFLAKITRNLSFDKYKSKSAAKRGKGQISFVLDELEECIASSSNIETDYQLKELIECINNFLEKITERDSNIFVRRYFFVESIAQIADRYEMKESNVMVNLSRTRNKLKIYLIKEGQI